MLQTRNRFLVRLLDPHPFPTLIQISISPQPSAAVKINDGSYSFHQENSERSLAKITPALQARSTFSQILFVR